MQMGVREQTGGNVFCPHRVVQRDGKVVGCSKSSVVSEAVIAKHATSKSFDAYLQSKKELLELKLRAEITKEERKRFEDEQKRLERMSEQEREIDKHRRHIVEEILTLKCPQCKTAFVDFEGNQLRHTHPINSL